MGTGRPINEFQQIVGEPIKMLGGNLAMDFYSFQGRVLIPLVTSCYMGEPKGLSTDFTFTGTNMVYYSIKVIKITFNV